MIAHKLLETMPYVSINGELIPSNQALSHELSPQHYGLSFFEGIRIRQAQDENGNLSNSIGYLFRLDDHLARLATSAEVFAIELPFSLSELKAQAISLAKANHCIDAYLRINVTFDSNQMGLIHDKKKVKVFMAYWPWPSYHAADSICAYLEPELEIPTQNMLLARAKRASNYDYRMLALEKAKTLGAGDTLLQASFLTNESGTMLFKKYLLEGSAQNIFLFQVRNGDLKVLTPPTTHVLDGITRRTVIDILAHLGVAVEIQYFQYADIQSGDSLIMTGTATGILPVTEILSESEKLQLADSDAVKRIKEIYEQGVRGRNEFLKKYLVPVELG